MKAKIFPILFLLLESLLAGCSVTDRIPEGQQLYTGIKRINYSHEERENRTAKRKRIKATTDSVGVITAVAEAVEAVEAALNGKSQQVTSLATLQQKETSQLTPEQRQWISRQTKAERDAFSKVKEELSAVLSYAPNGALFGSSSWVSPIQVGLWSYNTFVDSKTMFGKWMFKAFADAPIYIANVAPQTRAKVAHNILRNHGYFRNRVDFDVFTQSNPKKAKISYHIHTGPLFHIDSVAYVGFDAVTDSLLRLTEAQRKLHKGMAFSASALATEQNRIEQLMRNNGYYFYAPQYTSFQADTLAHPGFVQLRVMPSPHRSAESKRPWTMGKTHIFLQNARMDPIEGKQERRTISYAFSGKTPPLRLGMWRRAIAHRMGLPYRFVDQQVTLDRLYAMGVLSHMEVNYVPRDSSATCDTLDLWVKATLSKPYDSAFEMYATLKSNDQAGPGLSYELSRLNAFRAGETVSWKIFGSYEWMLGGASNSDTSNSYELGTRLSFKLPRIYLPWAGLFGREKTPLQRQRERELLAQESGGVNTYSLSNHRKRSIVGQTTLALSADWRNRSRFFQLVTMGLAATYNWYRSPQWKHELTPLDFSFNRILGTTAEFDSITLANPALYVSMNDVFVPSMSYTMTYTSQPEKVHPIWFQLTLKEAGNLTAGLYHLLGKPWSDTDKKMLGVPFAQFVKATAELRYSHRLNTRMRWVSRAYAGAVFSLGNSLWPPYSESFYIGGANSVRAFGVRTVGPGGYHPATPSSYTYIDQTGEIKLEANTELRAQLFGSLHGAIFLDAGNVWLARPEVLRPEGELSWKNLSRIAVGTGLGLRYDLQYLVFRFDVGMALHAPHDTGRSGFYNIPSFRKGLAFHFAIGYPF